jgi:hypothetical protein
MEQECCRDGIGIVVVVVVVVAHMGHSFLFVTAARTGGMITDAAALSVGCEWSETLSGAGPAVCVCVCVSGHWIYHPGHWAYHPPPVQYAGGVQGMRGVYQV